MVLLKRALQPFSIFLVLAISGCLVAQKLAPSLNRFSHKTHAEEDLDCDECHSKAASTDDAGLPAMKQCQVCHKGIDEELPEHKRIVTRFGKEPVWSHVTEISEEVRFSHKAHQEAKVQCDECHQGIAKSSAVTDKVHVDMDACIKCHKRKGAAAECSTCHQKIRKDVSPDNHKHQWERFHGQVARAKTGGSQNDCGLCHTEPSCTACHQEEAPRNHTNQWRHRGHLIAASMDRENCAVCHKSDFCDRCHQETAPRSHRGSFGSPRNRHCLTCHTPVSNEQCFLCHKSTPSHLADADPLPSGHTAAWNCRQCHGNGAPLVHPDNGAVCTGCHK